MQSTGLTLPVPQGRWRPPPAATRTGLDLVPHFNAGHVGLIVLTLTTGTALLMWMGELITQRGIGNGMSLLIFASVVSTLPGQGTRIQAAAGWPALIITAHRVHRDRWWPSCSSSRASAASRCSSPNASVGRRDVRRPEHLHPAQGQPGRRHPDHLRQLGALPAAAALVRAARRRAGAASVQSFVNNHLSNPGLALLPRLLRPADRRLRVLLHGHHLRPGQAGRHDPQAGRVHPRHPARAPDRALPRPGPQPHHAARARCSSPASPSSRRGC